MDMRIFAVVSGKYGMRHVENIRAHGPGEWEIETWTAPAVLPLMIDYPEDFVPAELPPADLILSFAENKGVAELLPEIVRITGAQALIAAVDKEIWLPRGLARQLRGWLADMGVVCVTPKPLCSLTETHYNVRQYKLPYEHPLISEFARYFGKPELHITVDPETRVITGADVVRDAFCGCTHFVAKHLVGVSADEADLKAGLLHHHYPCLAGMDKDFDFNDSLMHVSGNLLKDHVASAVRPYRRIQYIAPDKRSDSDA
jgi:hypothetical protein